MKQLYRCRICGAMIDLEEKQKIASCAYCGEILPVPDISDRKCRELFSEADEKRRNRCFDEAAACYEQLIERTPLEPEARWGRLLCKYGIIYTSNPLVHVQVLKVTNPLTSSFLEEADLKEVLHLADESQRPLYEAEARRIEEGRLAEIRTADHRDEEKAKSEEVKQKNEEHTKAQENRKKLNRKVLLCTSVFIIVFAFLFYLLLLPAYHYREADHLMEVGSYGRAEEIYEGLSGYREADDRAREAAYQYAEILIKAGQYDQAIEKYEMLGDYLDAGEKLQELIEAHPEAAE